MKRLLCYAHFDGEGQVKPFVKHTLNAMQTHCTTTIFASNSPVLEGDRVELLTVCSDVLINSNTGFDFYMWKLAMEKADLSSYDEVVLMNSSIYGPVSDIGIVFSAMENLACDFWGITECFLIQPHIQSYFLVFRRQVFESQAFQNFWNGVLPFVNKFQVIQSYEVGLTQWLLESGFRPGVYCSFEKLDRYCQASGKKLRKDDNTTLQYALELLNCGNPFLKRDAVRNRRVNMEQVIPYLRHCSYPIALINEQVLSPEIHCPLCGSVGTIYRKGIKDFIWMHNIQRYDYYRCKSSDCGVVWLGSNAIRRFPIVASPEQQTTLPPAKVAFPPELTQADSANILVIGCDNDITWHRAYSAGQEVSLHTRRIFEAHIESSADTLSPGIHSGEKRYDSILITSGLEMSAAPLTNLAEYFILLKPGGLLYLQTSNIQSPLSLLFQRSWYGLNAPRNKIFFNRKALVKALSGCGFIDIKVSTNIARTAEYAWHSINIVRNKWTSSRFAVPPDRGYLNILQWCARIVNFISGGKCGETLIGIARKSN